MGPSALFARNKRIPIYLGIVVAAVVVILLLVLVLPSVLGPSSGSGSGSGGSSGAMSFKQARPVAVSTVAGYQGGGWALLFAGGYAVNASYSLPINGTTSSLSGSYCTYVPAPGASGNVTLPAMTGNLSSGVASAWLFAFRNGAGDVALVDVVSGQGAVLGSLTGSSCASLFGLLAAVPGNVIDSTQVAAAVAVQSSAFRAANPDFTAIFGIIGGVSFLGQTVGSEWQVEYSTCAPTAPAGTIGTVFNATVDALNGTVIYYQTTSTGCSGGTSGGSTPLGSVLALSLVGESSNSATYLYNLSVDSAANGVTWTDTVPEITTPGGTPISTPWYLTATDNAGNPIAYYNSSSSAWSGASGQPISAVDGVTISSPVSLSGDLAVFQGVGAYSGSLSVYLP